MTTVRIDGRLNESTIFRVIDQVLDESGHPRDSDYRVHLEDIGFVEPAGVVVLSNLIERLKAHGATGVFVVASWEKPEIRYLVDARFFELYVTSDDPPSPLPRTTLYPLKRIAHDYGYSWVENRFTPWLARQMNVPSENLGIVSTALQEVMNNIRDHADADCGCVCAQFYPSKNKLVLAISDFGVGIPDRIRSAYGSMSDADAIAKSIHEGISSKTTPRNRGAGLATLVNYIARLSKSRLTIMSYNGCIHCFYEGDELITEPRSLDGQYPGTLVILEVSTNQVPIEPDQEEVPVW